VSALRLEALSEDATHRDFESVPRRLHGKEPCWVAPLPGDLRRAFDPRLQPTLISGRWQRWLARRNGTVVGRVAAFAPVHRPGIGYIGFFEADRSPDTARLLLDSATDWLGSRACRVIHGPIPVTARDGIGLLVKGFESPPAYGCPWNPEYYAAHFARSGFTPTVGLRSYRWTAELHDEERLRRLASRAASHGAITIRQLDLRDRDAEVRRITGLINDTLADAWQYEPISAAESLDLARQLRRVVDPALVLIAEDQHGPCGVALAIPDLNHAWREAGNALWPLGWLALLRARHPVKHVRAIALGVRADHRGGGVMVQLLDAWLRAAHARRYRSAILAQVFDDNLPMRRVLERLGFPAAARYAVFTRTVTG
jgi:GNAT superfamily N-acetyltransferase